MQEDNALKHYGVKGMKWGIRRFQNEDGSLTTAGKKRYGKPAETTQPEKEKKPRKSPEQLASERQKKEDVKNRGTLTNEQLKQKIERLKLEKELRELTKSEISAGRKFVEDVLKDAGKTYVKNLVTGAALYGTKAAIQGEFNKKEFGEAIFNGGPKKK